jgi:hypothetical protein
MGRVSVLVGGGLAAVVPLTASAQVVKQLGQGWEVEIFQPNMVDVFVDPSSPGTLVIEKIAEFGSIMEIDLTFTQNLPDAQTASQIVITNAVITNSTGQDWISFTETLTPLATFNQALSAGFSIAPFTTRQYSGGDTQVEFSGGTVQSGQVWSPGLASGGLVIDVDLSGSTPAVFTLSELPAIPAPGAMALIALGGLGAARRRR